MSAFSFEQQIFQLQFLKDQTWKSPVYFACRCFFMYINKLRNLFPNITRVVFFIRNMRLRLQVLLSANSGNIEENKKLNP